MSQSAGFRLDSALPLSLNSVTYRPVRQAALKKKGISEEGLSKNEELQNEIQKLVQSEHDEIENLNLQKKQLENLISDMKQTTNVPQYIYGKMHYLMMTVQRDGDKKCSVICTTSEQWKKKWNQGNQGKSLICEVQES